MNFGLRVVGRRADGYHEIESLFLPLDLADALELEVAEAPCTRVELRLEGETRGVPEAGDNLVLRAAHGFLETAGCEREVSLRLTKRIPAAAGLGGGSSDAAAVLRGLDHALPGAVDAAELRDLALRLGADVPFFLDPRPALVRGVGERCEALAAGWPSWHLLLANPGEPLSTAAVFGAYDEAPPPRGEGPELEALVRAASRDASGLAALLENDLEAPASRLCPAVAVLRQRLEGAGALAVGLSGSGATVFGVFPEEASARQAARGFAAPDWARVARTAESR